MIIFAIKNENEKNKIVPSESAIFPKELPLDRKNLALFVLVKDAFEVYKQIVLPPTLMYIKRFECTNFHDKHKLC